MGRKTYGAAQIGRTRALLLSNSGFVKPTAQQAGVAKDTVVRWSEGKYPPHVDPTEVDAAFAALRAELAQGWGDLAKRGIDEANRWLDEGQPGKALQAATTGAIGTDKSSILTGQATERVEVQDFASWLRSQRTASGTSPRPSQPETALDVAKPN